VKVDLHVHTRFSNDSLTILQDVIYWAQRRGMGALAITDHNTIEGAHLLSEISPIPIIVGEEILTRDGEVSGLFLQEAIPPNLDTQQTIDLIHEQGGLAYVPHPLDRLRSSALAFDTLIEIVDSLDFIEILNARVTFSLDNRLAEALAEAHHLLKSAGSDAHQGGEIGHAYVEMPPFDDAASFLASLSQGVICGKISSPLVHMGSTYAKVAKEIMASAPLGK